MKNKLSTKVVAVLLAAVLLLSSGIMSALPGIDFGSLLELKASAEDPKNDVFYDEEQGLYFTVDNGGARIIGTNPDELLLAEDGTFTLPNEVKYKVDDSDPVKYKVFKVFSVEHLAFVNSGTLIQKLVIPDNFRALTLSRSSFAGMSSLKTVQFDCSNATVTGPLFETVTEYEWGEEPDESYTIENEIAYSIISKAIGREFNGDFDHIEDSEMTKLLDYCNNNGLVYNKETKTISQKIKLIKNVYPVRDSEGILILSEVEGSERATIRFFDPSTENYTDIIKYPFNGNLESRVFINTTTKLDDSFWEFKASVTEENYISPNDVSFKIYDLETKTKTEVIDGVTHDVTEYDWKELSRGKLSIDFKEVENIGPENIVNGNGAIEKSKTVILFKSPVESIKLGSDVKNIPDYLFYDTKVDANDVLNAVKNAEKIGKYAFTDCFNDKDHPLSIDLSNVKEIGDYAFAACDGLIEVTIPEETEKLGSGAFTLCDNLDSVVFNATDCTVSGEPAPFSKSGVEEIVFGKDVSTVPSNVAADISTLRDVILLSDTLTIEDNAFKGSNNISNIETKEEKTLDGAEIGEGNDALNYSDINVSKHEHTYVPKEYPATCIKEGYFADTCRCGEIYTEKEGTENGRYNITAKLPHEFDPERSTEATCQFAGYDICKNCGSKITKEDDPKREHDYSVIGKSHEATCTEGAYVEKICSMCKTAVKKEYTSGEEGLGHDWVNRNTVAPGCETIGYTVQACSRCNATQNVDEQPANGHSWSAWTYHNNATVDSDGTRTRTCLVCGKSVTETAEGTKINDPLRDIHMYFGPGAEVDYSQEVIVVAKTSQDLPSGYTLIICEGSETLGETTSSSLEVNLGKVKSDRHLTAKIVDANDRVVRNSRNITFYKDLVVKVKTGFFNRLIALIKGFFRLLPVKKIGATALVK